MKKLGKTRDELYFEHVENCEYCQVNKDLNCEEWHRILSEAGKPKQEFNSETNSSTCENCKYWEFPKKIYGLRGRCHRFPPFSSHDDGYQPVTDFNDWCGEFRNKNYKNWLWSTLKALGLGVFFYVALRLFLNV